MSVTGIGRLWELLRGVRTPAAPPVAVLLPEPLRSQVVALRDGGDEVAAVRRVREQTGIGLLPAVLAVRAARSRHSAGSPGGRGSCRAGAVRAQER